MVTTRLCFLYRNVFAINKGPGLHKYDETNNKWNYMQYFLHLWFMLWSMINQIKYLYVLHDFNRNKIFYNT